MNTSWTIQFAYRLAQEFQRLLRAVREEVKRETDEALKQRANALQGCNRRRVAGRTRADTTRRVTESLYLQRRAATGRDLIRLVDGCSARPAMAWRNVVCLSCRSKKPPRSQADSTLPKSYGGSVHSKNYVTSIRPNIHEGLAIEVAFLAIFIV